MSSPCTHSASSLADSAATMYFVVFPCGSRPIFHSSHIPACKLYGTDSLPPDLHTDALFLGPPPAADEVPQQKLQDLAFPFRFGSKNAALLDGSAAATALQDGPLWSAHIEPVRNAKGDVRHYRMAVVSNLVVRVASYNGQLHTMQTKHAATALVLTVPPHMPYYSYLLDQFNSVVRGMLHVTLIFAMETTRRFFARLNRTTPLRDIETELLCHPSAAATYHTLRAILVNALSPRFVVPRLHSRAGEVALRAPPRHSAPFRGTAKGPITTISTSTSSSISTQRTAAVAEHLRGALHTLCRFSDSFASRVVAGLLSLGDWAAYGLVRGGAAPDPCGAYWREAEQEVQEVQEVQEEQEQDDGDTAQESAAPSRGPRPLATRRVGRVVVFSTDPDVAHCVLVLAAFFFRDARAARYDRPVRGGYCGCGNSAVRGEWADAPFAAQVTTCAHPSLPVQWVDEEYAPHRVDALLCSPHTVDNTLLIIVPRGMVCRRLRLSKTFTSNTIHVEKVSDCVTNLQPLQPFQCRVLDDESILPDETVRVALRDALHLQKSTGGTVSCAEFLEDFIVWLVMRSRAHGMRLASSPGLSEEFAASPLAVKRSSREDNMTNENSSANGGSYTSLYGHESVAKSPKPFSLLFPFGGGEGRHHTTSVTSALEDGSESRSVSICQSVLREDMLLSESSQEMSQLMRLIME